MAHHEPIRSRERAVSSLPGRWIMGNLLRHIGVAIRGLLNSVEEFHACWALRPPLISPLLAQRSLRR